MLLLLASVILLLVPRTTSENPNAASMESAITNWKYSKSNDAFFRNAQMHFYFMDTGMNPLRDLSDRALKFTYDVKYADGYVPTNYVDKTHISELTSNSDHIPPAFSFNNESKPTTLQWCIETNFEYNGVSKNASGPQCNGRGLSVRPLKASVVDYAYRCSIVGPEKCKKECAATRGVFRDNTCMSVSVARAICLKAQIEKDKLSITGGCQNNSQPEIYQNLEPGQNYSFTKIVS